ncbi:MAG: SHOCT domain-containing protein [Sulfurospirillaceae bacterium]|nr:SHOCT domain-containing protein [Sulfurospirillaceae bacterium]
MKNKFIMEVFLISSLVTNVFAQSGSTNDEEGMIGYWMMKGGIGMGFSWVVLILIGVVVYYMFNKKNNQDENDKHAPSARDILDQRFANGEIDKKEYEEKKEILEKR